MRIIAGRSCGLHLTTPKNLDLRPTADRVKESIFAIIGNRIADAQVLDLFAGTGNLGLESWSRGAHSITFIDKSQESIRIMRSNMAKCHAEQDCTVIKGDAIKSIEKLCHESRKFDFIFCDPPYNKNWLNEIILALGQFPIVNCNGWLIMERSRHDIPPALPEGYELFRSEKYGKTVVDFVKFIKHQ
ncbi:MAG: 16S rRNA (guanine(966)-N(2))-methyltransferase RsmD [Phascolarctobacterium sp.]|nr:16S rRNA (guanine(966)-N(2))-methyltransferase RsmD [Phascolarctobacterium sp.]